jgi:hypothetical protein
VKQSGLQAVSTFYKHRIQVKAKLTRTLAETTWHGLEAKTAEVTDDFTQGLDLTQRKFKTKLKEVKA